MRLHSPKSEKVHKELLEGYKRRLGEIENFSNKEEEKNTSFERTYLHNAIYLHNLWFEQLERTKEDTSSPFLEEILLRRESNLQSFIKWMNLFAKDGTPHGWAVWGWSYPEKTFVGFPIKGHDLTVPLGIAPLLVIDCWEHSYLGDFGLDFDQYLDVFWKELNWDKIEERHQELAGLFGFNIK